MGYVEDGENAGGKLNDIFGITVGGFDIMRFCGVMGSRYYCGGSLVNSVGGGVS